MIALPYRTLLIIVTLLSFLIAGLSEIRTSLVICLLLINGALWLWPPIQKRLKKKNAYNVEGERQLRVGNNKEAEEFLNLALAALGPKKGSLRKRLALFGNLAEAQRKQGKFVEAERSLAAATALTSGLSGQSAGLHADCLEGLAALHEDTGNYPHAQKLLQESLDLEQSLPKPNFQSMARRRQKLALAFHRVGDYSRATGHFAEAVELHSKGFGPNHYETGKALAELGSALEKEGRHAEAAVKLKQALVILEATTGIDSPDVADTLHHLAISYEQAGEPEKAIALMERLLSLRERLVGPRESKMGIEFFYLSRLYLDAGQLAKADEAALCALAILERHPLPELASGFETMAVLYTRCGRLADAAEARARARAVWQVLGVAPASAGSGRAS